MDIDTMVDALDALTESHKRLNGKLCDHLSYATPVSADDLRSLVIMADEVTKAIRATVRAVTTVAAPPQKDTTQ